MATCSESVVHFLRNAWPTSLGLAWSLHRNPHSRFDTLQSRIQPHFFFNSLNTVSMMVRAGETTAAVQTMSDLADLLRHALRDPEGSESTLAAEIHLIERYLVVERARFPDRLSWDVQIAPEVADVPIPPLLLQPLVENAIRHGIGRDPQAGRIEVRASRVVAGSSDEVLIEVSDDGPGLGDLPTTGGDDRGHGLGLTNTRSRIEAFYGAGTLELVRESGRTISRVRIPWALVEDDG